MDRRSALLVAAVLAGLAATDGAANATSQPPRPPAFVVAAAAREAVALGDPHPTSAIYVLTRRQAATKASSGGTVNSDQPVYLIVLAGKFIGGAVGPYPGHRMRGTVVSEVLDAKNGRETDFSIGPQSISTARLGQTGNLLPYLEGAKRPVCGVPDLHGSADFQGATGSQLGGLTVTNTGSLSCTLPSRAGVSIGWHRQPFLVQRTPFPPGWLARMNPRWAKSVRLLKPGRSAEIVLQWLNWCGPTPWPAAVFRPTVKLRLPDQPVPLATTVRDSMTAPFCNSKPARGTGSTLRVSPFLLPP